MSGEQLPQSIVNDLKKWEKRLKDVELRLQGRGASSLDELKDTEVKYLHATDAPLADQALRWDATADAPDYGGLARFADPTVVDDYFTASIPSNTAGTYGIDEFIVDSSWDINRPCLAFITAALDTTWVPQTGIDPPPLQVQLTDQGSGRVTSPGSTYEIAYAAANAASWAGTAAHSIGWVFLRGRPKANVRFDLSAGQAPGYPAGTTLRVITRCVRL